MRETRDIPEKFTRDGIDYELIQRHGNVAAIYESKHDGVVRDYEVWKLRVHKKDYPAYDVQVGDIQKPSTREWGKFGWTYVKRESAENKFGHLINEMTKNTNH